MKYLISDYKPAPLLFTFTRDNHTVFFPPHLLQRSLLHVGNNRQVTFDGQTDRWGMIAEVEKWAGQKSGTLLFSLSASSRAGRKMRISGRPANTGRWSNVGLMLGAGPTSAQHGTNASGRASPGSTQPSVYPCVASCGRHRLVGIIVFNRI